MYILYMYVRIYFSIYMYAVCSLPILAVLGHIPEEGRLPAGLFKLIPGRRFGDVLSVLM